MAPGFLGGVVHRTAVGVAVRTGEARAALEVDADVEPLLRRIEVGRRNEPRRGDAEGELEEVVVTHDAPGAGLILATSVPPRRPALKDKPPLEGEGAAEVAVLDRRPYQVAVVASASFTI